MQANVPDGILHALGADRRVWDPLIGHLRDHREVVTVDLPGFGESPPFDAGEPTPRALAAAVAQQLDGLGLDRPHVAGNSLGGWVALELGLQGVARTVTGIAPAGLWPEPLAPKAGIARRLSRTLLPLVGPAAATGLGRRLLLSGVMARPASVPGAAAAHLVRSYALAPGFDAVNAAMRAGRFEALERIRCPVTLVWPEDDRLVSRPRWVPDRVRTIELAGAGHIPMWDATERLSEILLEAGAGESRRGGGAPGAVARA
jgi:pimeloyl-ACP methyl ester carboxylesterase